MKSIQSSIIIIALLFALPSIAFEVSKNAKGENAKYEVKGDKVKVNNQLCASSRSKMEGSTLGLFQSDVKYMGEDPLYSKYKGKTLTFNQCCEGCVEEFKGQWKKDPEGIMKFHGLDK
jgi:hypothetical protein